MTAPDSGSNVDHAADAGTGRDPPDLMRLRQLGDEQAALRRVATLVAGGARPAEVFTVVANELGRLIGAEASFVSRLDRPSEEDGEPEGSVIVVGSYGWVADQIPVGFRTRLLPGTIQAAALRTGRPAQANGERLAKGPYGGWLGRLGLRAGVAAPIMVGDPTGRDGRCGGPADRPGSTRTYGVACPIRSPKACATWESDR